MTVGIFCKKPSTATEVSPRTDQLRLAALSAACVCLIRGAAFRLASLAPQPAEFTDFVSSALSGPLRMSRVRSGLWPRGAQASEFVLTVNVTLR